MTKYVKIIGASLVVVGLVLFFMFSKDIINYSSKKNTVKNRLNTPTTFIFGKKHIIQKEVVGEQGGEFTIQNTGTEFDGVKILVPAGNVKNETKIEIGYYDGEWKQVTDNKFSLPLVINLDKNLNEMGQPIEIHKKTDMAFAVDIEDGRLEPYTTVNDVTHTFRAKNIITFSDIVLSEELKDDRLKLISFQGNCDDTGPSGKTKILQRKFISADTLNVEVQTEVTCCVGFEGDIEVINGNMINLKYKEIGTPCFCLCKGILDYSIKGVDKRKYRFQLNGKDLK